MYAGWLLRAALIGALIAQAGTAHAISESFHIGDEEIRAVLNSTLTAGGGIRMQSPNVNLIGKSNLNRNVCGVPYQSCQGVFKDQLFPAQQLVRSPGAASVNHDDGDLNYQKYHFFQAVAKSTEDLNLTWRQFGFFGRLLYFYDFVNDDFTETHPNRLTPDNYQSVGINSRLIGGGSNNVLTPALLPYPGGRVYGPGGYVRSKRSDGEVLSQAGTNLQYLDSYIYGKLPLWEDKELTFKLGRQLVNWGESTTLVINSINQANPLNANNFTRIGSQVEEVFTPINMVFLSFAPFENTTLEGFYQLEWKNLESYTPGTYFSTTDVGTSNAINTVSMSFGASPEDPYGLGALQYSPLALLTNTSLTARRLPDMEPRTSGQYGFKLDYYADWLNEGTDLSLYYMHYHSRLPMFSVYAANPSCARAAGNSRGNDATDLLSFLADCPDVPLTVGLVGGDPANAKSSVAAFDSARFQLQYPEDIDLIGFSFNTTVGDYSIQGEVAYRPNLPLQVDEQDLVFAAFGPTLTSCHDPSVGCAGPGILPQIGFNENGSRFLRLGTSSDYAGNAGYHDTFNVLEGMLPGAARSFPNFIIPYRGGKVGDNPGCAPGLTDSQYHPGMPCWIQGWERFQVFQFNMGLTRVLGASDNPFGADQIQLVGEWGAQFVPNLPPLDQLQLEADGTNYAASAGADGSGANGSRQACSTTPDCAVGGDGLRFNPHQQDLSAFPDKLSWGYRVISIFKYESVLPGISLQPTFVWSQDVAGTSPGPGGNFIAGRKQVNTLLETRYQSALSFSVGYTWYWGGGAYNLLSDRDFAQFFVKYQF
jgi:hypothetical protein